MRVVFPVLLGWIAITADASSEEVELDQSLKLVVVEPGAAVLPANFLKFYLHFETPMERGDVFKYLRLVKVLPDGKEREVIEPFREVELWDEHQRRLTLWLHPGRQKPGVNLNVEFGPILEEGGIYRLEISQDWKTESGETVDGNLQYDFHVGAFDKEQPRPHEWIVSRAGRSTVRVKTLELLDFQSLLKRVRVEDSGGKEVTVYYWLTEDGFSLTRNLEANADWKTGSYRIVVDPALEDLAGNSVARPFNVDLSKSPDFVEQTDSIVIPFEIPAVKPK